METIHDPILGLLQPSRDLADTLEGTIAISGEDVLLTIALDGCKLADCLLLARDFVADAEALTASARAAAAHDQLENYNENWRTYGIYNEDGTTGDVTNPILNADQFANRLNLTGVNVSGSSLLEFCFSDGGLFAGHSVFVTVFDGLSFTKVSVDLFG